MDAEQVYAMDWDIRLEGRAWGGGEGLARYERAPEKLELIRGRLCWSEEARLLLLGLLLENVGLNAAVRLAPPERWREALAHLERSLRG